MSNDKSCEKLLDDLLIQRLKNLEQALQTAIDKRLGEGRWKPEDLEGRVRCEFFKESRQTIYYLDNEVLLQVNERGVDKF